MKIQLTFSLYLRYLLYQWGCKYFALTLKLLRDILVLLGSSPRIPHYPAFLGLFSAEKCFFTSLGKIENTINKRFNHFFWLVLSRGGKIFYTSAFSFSFVLYTYLFFNTHCCLWYNPFFWFFLMRHSYLSLIGHTEKYWLMAKSSGHEQESLIFLLRRHKAGTLLESRTWLHSHIKGLW